MVLQPYESEVGNEYVIRGNGALVRCGIPSYVADLVAVDAWIDSHGQALHRDSHGLVGTFGQLIDQSAMMAYDPSLLALLIN